MQVDSTSTEMPMFERLQRDGWAVTTREGNRETGEKFAMASCSVQLTPASRAKYGVVMMLFDAEHLYMGKFSFDAENDDQLQRLVVRNGFLPLSAVWL